MVLIKPATKCTSVVILFQIPARIPIKVIPICTVDKNLLGALAKPMRLEHFIPFFAMFLIYFFLARYST
jgi:hypothetical protein